MTKDVTFVETESFFGPTSTGDQGKHISWADINVDLPLLGMPHDSQIHGSSILPLDEQNQQDPQAELPLTLLPSSLVRFKGSPYVFKRQTQ